MRRGRPEGGNGPARRRDGGGDRRQEAPFRVKEHARTRRGVQSALCCLPPRAPAAPNRRGSRHAHGQRWACWVHVSVRRRGASAPALPARVGGSRTSPFFWAHLSLGRAARRVGTQPCTPRRTRAPGLNLWPRARAGRAEGRGSRGVRDRPPEGLLWPRQRRFGFSWAERAVECAMGRARPRSPAAVNGATDTNADAPPCCERMRKHAAGLARPVRLLHCTYSPLVRDPRRIRATAGSPISARRRTTRYDTRARVCVRRVPRSPRWRVAGRERGAGGVTRGR